MNSSSLPYGVYVLAREADWYAAQQIGFWQTQSLQTQGFIHAASHKQVAQVCAKHFSDEARICLLKLDEASLIDYLHWDAHPTSGELFPHIYCAIPLACVERVLDWPKRVS